jgi:hypothetical protein
MTIISMNKLKGISVPDSNELLLFVGHNYEELLGCHNELNSGTLSRKRTFVGEFYHQVLLAV